MNTLYEIVLEVDTHGYADVHPRFAQASQYTYVIAGDAEEATQLARDRLLSMGLVLIDCAPRITLLHLAAWDQFVRANWPAYRDVLPTQAEIMAVRDTPAVFLGSFYPHE